MKKIVPPQSIDLHASQSNPPMYCDRHSKSSAAVNLDKLGDYAFAYGILIALGLYVIMGAMIIIGIPLDGEFGVIELTAILFRVACAPCLAFSLYAFYCYRIDGGNSRLGISAKLFALSAAYWSIGFLASSNISADLGKLMLHYGADCVICYVQPLL